MAVRRPGGESLEVIQLEVVGPLLGTGLALLVTTQLRSIRQQQACKKQLPVRTGLHFEGQIGHRRIVFKVFFATVFQR